MLRATLAVKQDNKAISYCYSPTKEITLIAKQDAEVTWHESPDVLDRKIRAYNPWPIAWAILSKYSLMVIE
jgi:methionyl-tRNA formyltransferase